MSAAKSQPSKSRNKRNRKSKKPDPVAFWGDPEKLPEPATIDVDTPNPLAIVDSLGRAPMPGTPAEPYFALIYARAAGLATALSHILAEDEDSTHD